MPLVNLSFAVYPRKFQFYHQDSESYLHQTYQENLILLTLLDSPTFLSSHATVSS